MKCYLNRRYTVQKLLPYPHTQSTIVGCFVQRSIGKSPLNTGYPLRPVRTFRIRRGNGFYGTKVGELIQDQYDYFVPSSINNPEGEPARVDFAAAVAAWKALPLATKTDWNKQAVKLRLHMSGMNLYIRRWRLGQL